MSVSTSRGTPCLLACLLQHTPVTEAVAMLVLRAVAVELAMASLASPLHPQRALAWASDVDAASAAPP